MLPFTGEVMTCVMCGREQQSDPAVESQWRCIVLGDGARYYICPKEFPPDGAPAAKFAYAYEKVMRKIVRLARQPRAN